MRSICFYMTRFPGYAGIETVTYCVIKRLHELHPDWNLVVVAHFRQYVKEQELPSDIKLYHFPGADGAADNYDWHNHSFSDFLTDILKNEHIDTLIYQDSYAPTHKLVCKLSRQLDIRLIVFEHSTPLNYPLAYRAGLQPFIKWLYYPVGLLRVIMRKRCLYRHCYRYVLLSRHFIDEFFTLTKIHDRSKIAYINNPVVPLSEQCVNTDKENIILYVGRLTRMKRVDLMLKVWHKLSVKYPGWRFVCVGDGEERHDLEHYVHENNICNVEFCGYQQPSSFYARSKINWMMSIYEGWGMTLVEAMQHGCVPIAFNTFSSVNDIIDNGSNGYLVEDNNEEEFLSQTSKLMENHILLQQMSQAAKDKVHHFEIEKIIGQWEKLL